MPRRICEHCSTPLRQAATGRPPRFCDATCRQAGHRAEQLAAAYPEPWQQRALAHGWRPPEHSR
jgi:hypothetical protein